mmetsp:Transcript_35070/g.90969  ORF Transcript_35070/g.90969 Transcript_35070/m.90969 type:complete len:205 (-) Transcript_35070:532-1146(-)
MIHAEIRIARGRGRAVMVGKLGAGGEGLSSYDTFHAEAVSTSCHRLFAARWSAAAMWFCLLLFSLANTIPPTKAVASPTPIKALLTGCFFMYFLVLSRILFAASAHSSKMPTTAIMAVSAMMSNLWEASACIEHHLPVHTQRAKCSQLLTTRLYMVSMLSFFSFNFSAMVFQYAKPVDSRLQIFLISWGSLVTESNSAPLNFEL